MKNKTTVDSIEVAKFAQHATQWWNKNGPLKTLHDINPVRLDFIKKFVNLENSRVLDVGCGGGVLSEGLALCGAKVTGLYVEPDAIAAAKTHSAKAKLKIDYVCSPIEEYKAKKFDVITCMEMLEHVPDPDLVIKNCARLLKPDGYLFLSTINRTLKSYGTAIIAAEYILNIIPRQTHDYDKFIKPSELSAIIRKHSLSTLNISGMSYNPFTRIASLDEDISVNYLMVCK